MRKMVSIIIVLALLMMPTMDVQAAEQSTTIDSRMDILNVELNLPIGGSYTYEFCIGSEEDPMSGFGVNFKNVTGKYKFFVIDENSQNKIWHESPELTGDYGLGFSYLGSVSWKSVFKVIVINTGYTNFTSILHIPPAFYNPC